MTGPILTDVLPGNIIGTTDPVNPGIDVTCGSSLIYRQASGLEKALADVDGVRIMAIYAELVKDQWNPYSISSTNLPYLAWAMGVNLWETDWSDEFKRWWVANQWELKSQRGSLLGISRFVQAVGGNVVSAITPPALFYPGASLTPAQKAAYVARFPQLRIYPYVEAANSPWLCYFSKLPSGRNSKNGSFMGPTQKFFPTDAANIGGRYTRIATIWDQGVETTITLREIQEDPFEQFDVVTYDQVTVPAGNSTYYYMGQPNKYLVPDIQPTETPYAAYLGIPIQPVPTTYKIFLGALGSTASRMVNVPRDGSLTFDIAQAIYETIWPNNQLIDIVPEYVAQPDFVSKYSLCPSDEGKTVLYRKYLPPSTAWKSIFERWYLFDPLRVPDARKASVYMGNARFGIPNYTAILKIEAFGVWQSCYLIGGSGITTNGFSYMRGFFKPYNTDTIDKVRRAVTASMAIRDTIGINTVVKRLINTNDSFPCDGTFSVGEYVDS